MIVRSPETGVIDHFKSPLQLRELSPGPLGEQSVLLTSESSPYNSMSESVPIDCFPPLKKIGFSFVMIYS